MDREKSQCLPAVLGSHVGHSLRAVTPSAPTSDLRLVLPAPTLPPYSPFSISGAHSLVPSLPSTLSGFFSNQSGSPCCFSDSLANDLASFQCLASLVLTRLRPGHTQAFSFSLLCLMADPHPLPRKPHAKNSPCKCLFEPLCMQREKAPAGTPPGQPSSFCVMLIVLVILEIASPCPPRQKLNFSDDTWVPALSSRVPSRLGTSSSSLWPPSLEHVNMSTCLHLT